MREVLEIIDMEIDKLRINIKEMEKPCDTLDYIDLMKKKGELDGFKHAKEIIINIRRFIETGHK